MRSSHPIRGSRLTRLIAVLVACVLTVQGIAAAIERVWMPAHTHLSSVDQHPQVPAQHDAHESKAHHDHDHHEAHEEHEAATAVPAVGHSHQHASALPHHHDQLQPDVILVDDDTQDTAGGSASKSLLDVFDVPTNPRAKPGLPPPAGAIVHASGRYRFAGCSRPERPPRSSPV